MLKMTLKGGAASPCHQLSAVVLAGSGASGCRVVFVFVIVGRMLSAMAAGAADREAAYWRGLVAEVFDGDGRLNRGCRLFRVVDYLDGLPEPGPVEVRAEWEGRVAQGIEL